MSKKNCGHYSGIGGQAVLEGVMMKNKDEYAVAVRKPDGNIEVKKEKNEIDIEKISETTFAKRMKLWEIFYEADDRLRKNKEIEVAFYGTHPYNKRQSRFICFLEANNQHSRRFTKV